MGGLDKNLCSVYTLREDVPPLTHESEVFMQRVENIRRNLEELIGCNVAIEFDCGRNKSEETTGTIRNTYRGIFTVEVDFGSKTSGIVSYSYTDVLCEKVKITPLN